MRQFHVYILTNHSRTLYVGITNDLQRRLWEHREKINKGCFTERYNINQLVYYEDFDDPWEAIGREKQIKKWRRSKKVSLIERFNPGWWDLLMND